MKNEEEIKKKLSTSHYCYASIDHDGRLESWGKLESFIEVIISRGGYGKINKTQNDLID